MVRSSDLLIITIETTADQFMRAVLLTPGAQFVSFRYQPISFVVGIWLAVFFWARFSCLDLVAETSDQINPRL